MSPNAWSIVQSTVQIVGAVVTSVVVVVLGRCCAGACKRAQGWSRKALANLHAAQTWESFALNCIGLIEDQVTRERLQEAHRIMSEAMPEEAERFVAYQDAGIR